MIAIISISNQLFIELCIDINSFGKLKFRRRSKSESTVYRHNFIILIIISYYIIIKYVIL